ncbi:hypothetical protein P152DRAFT_474175 [Eremomyces bilateralis CBS 781.70]|uniref:RNA polymerase I associated factor, A49-like protein n=1 Tax=Eremomyces bilateralis CBS 781.70 TaxID=1392243 RepID=A0A6G1G1D7_9PEZI|nr:uncharacterized protein P152DRAFT_474175 [Eremomyces bilateralis CBS 781.70]KAF1811925.1 hypothetical protein P152DRAFT_474175 [Eremomyces bilateralis CBS 781.70]
MNSSSQAPAKKRKRTSDTGSNPSKRVSLQDKRESGKLKVQYEDADIVCPVIAESAGIALNPKLAFQPYKRERRSRRRGQPAESRGHDLLLQSSQHPRIDYTATADVDDTIGKDLTHYVGVYDSNDNTLKIVPARKLIVRGSLREKPAPAESENADGKSFHKAFELRRELGMEFGTVKTKKHLQAQASNALAQGTVLGGPKAELDRDDPLVKAMLAAMPKTDAAATSRETLQLEIDAAKPRPDANLNAETADMVYTPESVIGQELMSYVTVQPWIEAIEAGNDVQLGSQYVARRLKELVDGGDIKRLKCLRYLLFLVEVYQKIQEKGKRMKRWPKKEDLLSSLSDGSEDLIEKSKRKFSEDRGDVSRWHLDLLITHIAALTLIIDEFDTDTFDIRNDLHLENQDMTQYFREIGCKVKSVPENEYKKWGIKSKADASTHRMARLKLPLEFPKIRAILNNKRR